MAKLGGEITVRISEEDLERLETLADRYGRTTEDAAIMVIKRAAQSAPEWEVKLPDGEVVSIYADTATCTDDRELVFSLKGQNVARFQGWPLHRLVRS